MNKQDEEAVKRFRDEFDDMRVGTWESPIHLSNDKVERFILAEIKRAREECYEQMDEIIGEDDEDEFWSSSIPDFIRNKLRAEQRAKLQALREEL